MDVSSQERPPSFLKRLRGHLCLLWVHVLGHVVYAALALVVGILLFSATTFENTTYMKEGETIGPMFQTKLLLVKAESHVPMCSFRAGLDDAPLGIPRGGLGRVGDYEIDLLECDSDRKFAVLHVRGTTPLYHTMGVLWDILHLR
jgi:hypothetical protein